MRDKKANVYNFFDRIVCINLIHRTDKKQRATKIFNKLHIPITFFSAQQQPQGGRYGCFHSHISVIKKAYDDRVQNLLIFEDDVVPSPSYCDVGIHKAISFLKINSSRIDMLQLGYFPFQDDSGSLLPFVNATFTDNNREFIKITAAGTHAYCLTRSGMHKILNSNWTKYIDDLHFDIFIVGLHLDGYCVVPTLFDQNSCLGTDNLSRTKQERIARPFMCASDRLSVAHNISLFKKYLNYISIILLATTIAITILLIYNYKFKRMY